MGTLNTRLVQDTGVRLAVRIGIHTGLVVVGEMGSGGRQEHLALGDTPNLAARLQGLAAPDTVVISAATSRLVQGYFTCQDLGTHALKGLDDAGARVSGPGGKCGAESPGRGRGHWPHPAGGPRGGGGAAAGALGAEHRRGWGRWCCSAARRALANRAWSHVLTEQRGGAQHATADVALFAVSYQQRPLSGHRAPPAAAALAPRRDPRGAARHAGAGAADGAPAPGGGGAAPGRAAVAAGAGAVSAAHPESAAPEAEDAGGAGGLAAGRGGAAAGAGGVGRPALGRPLHPGAARPAPGPGPHGPPAHWC